MLRNKIAAFLLVVFSILPFVSSALAAMSEENRKDFMKMSQEERDFLLMYFDEDDLYVVSATRSLKSITRIAENVEVVTASDIELMNAHTVAEVLNKVVGVQVRLDAGPGSFAYVLIQGSESRHVAVFIDGILTNDFMNGFADTARIPVQIVDRIEIIKGPASSAWGSSLGGVVNIITKAGSAQARSGGTISGSFGERTFLDLRSEFYGKKGDTGYYFYAGRMQADGFNGVLPHNGDGISNLYLKISQDLTRDSELVLTTFYNKGEREWTYPDAGYFAEPSTEALYASLTFNTNISDSIKLSLSGRTLVRDFEQPYSDGYVFNSRDSSSGVGTRLSWTMRNHSVVMGADYDNGIMKNEETGLDNVRERIEKYAAYANDTISLGKLTVTPGIRFDRDNIVGDFVSPSLGLTYDIFEKTLVRAFVARGFNSAPLPYALNTIQYGYKGNPNLKPEEVVSYQLGLETGVFKYFWLKASGFRHDIRDAIVEESIENDPVFTYTFANKARVRRQGIEVEIRTTSFHNFTLAGGTTLTSTKDRDTGETIRDTPTTTSDISLKYDDQKTLKAILSGHYIWWNSTSAGSYNSMIVNANLIKQVFREGDRSGELFMTGHNLFNGQQRISGFTTPLRWFEVGMRLKF